ncbi:MAG: OB-fold nucleic acid binding domain-containing protein [Nanoarchaeota archaeon]|mgnify:CR=1 FL=1
MADEFKRHTAYKLKIGDVLSGNQIVDGEKLKFVEINGKNVARVNLIANVVDKFIQDEEKKFASLTLDDSSGQIKLKTFGEDIEKLKKFEQGDTILAVGMVREWNKEIYVTPEIIKKKQPEYLLLRKLENDLKKPVQDKKEISDLKDKIVTAIKREEQNEGIEIRKLVEELGAKQDTINQEIRKLLEEGTIYEPRPGRVRYLG